MTTPVTITKIYVYQSQSKKDQTVIKTKVHNVDCVIDADKVESIQQHFDAEAGGFDSQITEVHMTSGEIIYARGSYTSLKNTINP